jgi:hypothetical protein
MHAQLGYDRALEERESVVDLPVPSAQLQSQSPHSKCVSPPVSLAVVLTNYRTAQQFKLALRSVLTQSVHAAHIIVVGCSPKVQRLALRYRRQLDSIEVPFDLGSVMDPRWWPFILTVAEFVAYLEPGDAWFPNHLAQGVAVLQQDYDSMLVIAKQQLLQEGIISSAIKLRQTSPPTSSREALLRVRFDRGLRRGASEFPITSISSIVARTYALSSFATDYGSLLDSTRTLGEDLGRWRIASRRHGITWVDSVTSTTDAPGTIFYKRYGWRAPGEERGHKLRMKRLPGNLVKPQSPRESNAELQVQALLDSIIDLRRKQDIARTTGGVTDCDEPEGNDEESIGFLESVFLVYVPSILAFYIGALAYLEHREESGSVFMAVLAFVIVGGLCLVATFFIGLAMYTLSKTLSRGVTWLIRSCVDGDSESA